MTAQTSRPVAVEELLRAWHAVQDGAFRHPARPQDVAPATPIATVAMPKPAERWTPTSGELVLPVVGAAGSCGATTVALALATVVEGRARVVECASASMSGLAAASMTELGADDHGWVHGTRDQVRLDRAPGVRTHPDAVPTPSPIDTREVTVIDVGFRVEQVLDGHAWLSSLLTNAGSVVVVARATIPGLRRLESTLHLLDAERTIAAVLGQPRRRWPRAAAHGVGGLTAALVADGRLVEIPEDRTLALHGLTPAPLPARLLTAAGALLSLIEGTPHHAH